MHNDSITVFEVTSSRSEDSKMCIIIYVNQLSIHQSFKDAIIAKDFISEILPIYTQYPSLFARAFSVKENVDSLNIAGFLFHKSIIILDNIFDSQTSNQRQILLSAVCQEEAIKLLSSIYPLNSPFWTVWNKRRNEYVSAFHIERGESVKSKSSLDFELLADYKSAFGKIPIDALFLLSNNEYPDLYDSLLSSHRNFYCGLQILDDINDIKEDIRIKQFNYAVNELQKSLSSNGQDIETLAVEYISKYFFISGIAEQMFDKALFYLNKSIDVIASYPGLEEWVYEVTCVKNLAITKKLNIKAFIAMSISELNLSKVKSQSWPLAESKNKSLEFVFSKRNPDGSWNEFINEAGTSDTWATGYILSVLLDNNIDKTVLSHSIDFLKTSSKKGLWGYNKEWIADSDSSTFNQLAIFFSGNGVNDNSLKEWLKFQTSDGGFSTYNNEHHLRTSLNWTSEMSVTGWLDSHFCVSASAYYFLLSSKQFVPQQLLLEKYLKERLLDDELPTSYWWSSPIYSLSYLILSLPYCKDYELTLLIKKSAAAAIRTQGEDGSFNNGSALCTSLLIHALCHEPVLYNDYRVNIEKAVKWLLINQMSDGSWESSHDMILPTPAKKRVNEDIDWPVKTAGLNVKVYEFNRLFTTVMGYAALNKYSPKINE